jgi:hypothetical protein
MNIVGESFNQKIARQVIQRQKIYGSISRSNEELTYLNTKTGWCQLLSGVEVDKNIINNNTFNVRNLNIQSGVNLAKNHVLWGGITSITPDANNVEYYSFQNNQGIATDGSIFNTGDYGFGGLELGIRPMPGIISAEIKTETRGSIKRATLKIQANNRTQFDIIDLLYMRLGYSVLLQWGNSSYFDNSGTYISDNPHSLADDFLLGKISYETYNQKIQEKRLASCGNYDAIIGKVVNFSWNFTKDLTYEISIKLISMGDVIESLKTNALLPGGSTNKTEATPATTESTPPAPTTESVIKDFANIHEIGKMFYEKQQILQSKV